MKKWPLIVLTLLAVAACRHDGGQTALSKADHTDEVAFYSPAVKDSFHVFVYMPPGLSENKKGTYPVVYLLDANLYFEVMTGIFKKYSEVGLMSPAILVGIGYKDFRTMDSLRDRDYTYPAAIPEYGMRSSGKGDQFLAMITKQIIPYIDSHYPSDKSTRVLMGHSLGGYFTLYALQQAFVTKSSYFSSYIAASPSLDFNHNYLAYEFEKLSPAKQGNTKVYITYGGLEDAEEAESGQDSTRLTTGEMLAWATAAIRTQENVQCRGDMYSNLGHMDMAPPTFIRGLQWALNMTE